MSDFSKLSALVGWAVRQKNEWSKKEHKDVSFARAFSNHIRNDLVGGRLVARRHFGISAACFQTNLSQLTAHTAVDLSGEKPGSIERTGQTYRYNTYRCNIKQRKAIQSNPTVSCKPSSIGTL